MENTRTIQAVFIDRDGTMGGNGHFIHPNDFNLFPHTNQAIQMLKEAGILILALTNQHRISKGQATIAEFREQFTSFGCDDSYICPHEPSENCECHKPAPGLLLQAAKDYQLDLTKCVVIGDVGATDMLAAEKVGAIKVLVRTGWGESSLDKFREGWKNCEPDYIADNLLTAVTWLETTYLTSHKM